MEGLFTLLALAIVMATTSFVVGSLPLAFKLSPSQLRFISSIGMGVLVGTSLIVIIPEGVETLYSAHSVAAGPKGLRTRSVQDGRWWQQETSVVRHSRILQGSTAPIIRMEMAGSEVESPSGALDVATSADATRESSHERRKRDDETSSHDDTAVVHEEESSPHAWIGVALISGFIVMYLIDKLPEFATPSKNERTPYHISLDNLGSGLRRGSTSPREEGLLDHGAHSKRSHSFATTIGLVIHAAADGIALGASSSNAGLSFIIFLAIMVHKAPASFGLTTVLLKQGLSSRTARAHLLVFSLAAPAGALATYLLVQLLGSGAGIDEPTSQWRTGMLLLFSAGTFLYVAMHTMQGSGPNSTGQANGYAEPRDSLANSDKSLRDLAASVVGMILPLFLQIGHAH